ncbi:hypothetical protein FRC08_007926 [Ceratobasidium sp. 394]|nr:hypothetical protein FRC08_007926 [Ceratobasidium sp. 394]
MSVPPSGAGEAQVDEVRRAWSCEPPVNVEVQVGRNFAGDWSQCMVIDVSDDEDEGDLGTDASSSADESELEDEEVQAEKDENRRKVLGGSRAGECLGGMVKMLERDEPGRDCADAAGYIRSRSGASKYYLSKGGSSSSSGSGANAVEAVQSAIVKLAMDNVGLGHAQRRQTIQTKFSATPPPSAGLVARYPVHSLEQKQPLDYPQHSRTSQIQASINAYFDPPTVHVVRSYSQTHHNSYTKSNPALDSLRSGLEKRVAASASAVEEAVRARSASPNIPNQVVRHTTARSPPGSGLVLPPRLRRLHGMHAWTPPKLSLAQLEIPAFSQKSSSAQSPALPSLPTSPMPSPVVSQQSATVLPSLPELLSNNINKQPPPPGVASPTSLHAPQPGLPAPASPHTKKGRPAHLQDIVVDQTLVPPAPATAPLARSKRGKHGKRRSADGASPKHRARPAAPSTNSPSAPPMQPNAPAVEPSKEPATPNLSQPSGSTSSPPAKPKPRSKHPNRFPKPKKRTHPGKHDVPPTPPNTAPTPVPATPTAPPLPPSIPATSVPPTPGTQENTTATKPARKKRYHKKSKTNKPGSTSTGS